MKRFFWLPVIVLMLVSCVQTPTPITVTRQVTQLVTIEVTREIIVTATYSGPTPTFAPTFTPAPTATSAPTVDQTKADKKDGSYMVGSEIAPGIWRSSGGSQDKECWLTIKTYSGDLEGITGELPGATFRIPSGQYMAYIGGGSGNKCTWTFMMP